VRLTHLEWVKSKLKQISYEFIKFLELFYIDDLLSQI
jgi:hypothetical protein